MTKKSLFIPAPTEDDIEDVFETDTRPQNQRTRSETLLDELVEDLNDTSDNVSLRIYQQTGSGQESLSFVESIPHDKFANQDELLMYLRDAYGPGAYRLQVRVSGKLRANKLVQIVAKKTVSQIAPNNDGGALAAIMQRMEKQDQMIAALLQKQNQPQQNSKKEFLEEMLVYKQLFSNGNSGGGLGQIQEAIAFVKELGVPIGGPLAEREEGFGDILEKALPLLQSAMTQQPQPKPQPVNPAMQQQNALKLQIKMAVDSAVRSASRGGDPAAFAEMADTQLGEKAVALVSDPNIFNILSSYNPGVAANKQWFEDVIDHIKAMNGLPSRFSSEYDNDDPIDASESIGGTDNVPIEGDA